MSWCSWTTWSTSMDAQVLLDLGWTFSALGLSAWANLLVRELWPGKTECLTADHVLFGQSCTQSPGTLVPTSCPSLLPDSFLFWLISWLGEGVSFQPMCIVTSDIDDSKKVKLFMWRKEGTLHPESQDSASELWEVMFIWRVTLRHYTSPWIFALPGVLS